MTADAASATRPSRRIAFRGAFDPADPGAWIALLTDVAALANSGGGALVVGVDRSGRPTHWDARALLAIDHAAIVDAFAPYLGERFDDFDVRSAARDGMVVAVVDVHGRTGAPLVFEHAGPSDGPIGNEATAVAAGTVYFRHGSRSEPATAADLRRFTNREIQRERREWSRNVRKVASAPPGAHVVVTRPRATPEPDLVTVRVVDDANAPALARADFDVTHPYRQTEVVRTFNERVGDDVVTPYDIQCVRRVHHVDRMPRFFHVPKFGSPQYSEAFIAWLLAEYAQDVHFFDHAKEEVRRLRTTRHG